MLAGTSFNVFQQIILHFSQAADKKRRREEIEKTKKMQILKSRDT
jgi:hypothetical protein